MAATETTAMKYYPIFLELKDRPVVVVGGGEVAERKVKSLVNAGAAVTVVSPGLTPGLSRLTRAGAIDHIRRGYETADLTGAFLVIGATDDGAVNERVAADARYRGIPVNVVDEPNLSTFIMPAVISRGDLQICVSTGGRSPALARHLRQRLEEEFGPEYERYVQVVGQFRERLRVRESDPERRRQAYGRLLASDLPERLKRGRVDLDSLVREFAS